MNLVIFLSLFHVVFVSSLTIHHDMKMIMDVLTSFEISLSVAALLSWPKAEKLKFGRMMTKIKTQVSFLGHCKQLRFLPTDDKALIVVDLEDKHAFDYLKTANATRRLASPYRWLLINKGSENAPSIPPSVSGLTILPDSEVIIASLTSNNSYDIRSIYQIKQHKPWIQEYYGQWTAAGGFNRSKHMMSTAIAIRRKNLRGETLITSTVVNSNDTSTEIKSLKDITNNYYRMAYYQTIHMYEFLNLSYSIKLTRFWGQQINGTWNGMVGEVAHGDAQFGDCLFGRNTSYNYDRTSRTGQMMFFTKERLKVVDFLSQPVSASVVFVFREPRLSYQNNLFLLPFQAYVWYSILGFTAIIIFILYITAKWEQKNSRNKSRAQDAGWLRPNIGDIAIVAISAIAQQGTTTELKGGRGRVVIFLLFLIYLFLYTAYSASIVVLLQTSSNQIRTLKDLLNSKLELGVEDTVFNRREFTTATEPIRKAIYEKKVALNPLKPKFLPLTEGVQKLKTEPFAFNMYTPIGYKLIGSTFLEHEKCGLREIPYIQDNKTWYTCKKNSPYKELFKLGLCRMKEHGLLDRANKIFFGQKPHCSVQGGNFVSVSIIDFYPALLLLLYGIICSLTLLIVEIFVHSQKKKSRVLTE